MEINAIFVISTKEILYSRCRHDYISAADNSAAIDGGRDYTRIIGSPDNIIEIVLDGDVLLNQILEYDYTYGNKKAKAFPEGYHGRFQFKQNSNLNWYKKLVKDFEKISKYVLTKE